MSGAVVTGLEELVEVPTIVVEGEGTDGTVPTIRGALELDTVDSCDNLHDMSNSFIYIGEYVPRTKLSLS